MLYSSMIIISYLHTCLYIMYIYIYIYIYIELPVIDKGSFMPRPSVFTRGDKRVKIGTPVYVYSGFIVRIDCKIVNGSRPNKTLHGSAMDHII